MGAKQSICNSSEITNIAARKFFDSIVSKESELPKAVKESSDYQKLIFVIFESLKRTPELQNELGIMITGRNLGPTFVKNLLLRIDFPMNFTKVSLRKSSLKKKHAISVADFIKCIGTLVEFDGSENQFDEGSTFIIAATLRHPSLKSFVLEDCGVSAASSNIIQSVLLYNRKLETFRIGPAKLSDTQLHVIVNKVEQNRSLLNVDIAPKIEPQTEIISKRNTFIQGIVDSIAICPFDPIYGTKIKSFKSVNGREMMMGRIRQKAALKGTSMFNFMEETDKRATLMQNQEDVSRGYHLRCAHAEMCGHRDRMEDVSIIMNDFPYQGAMLFGLFDGHGGREAAEYASQHLPQEIKKRIEATRKQKSAFINAFIQVHANMKQSFVYVGTTAVIAVVSQGCLTVAAVGDSRCVLCRNGKAVRLTTDHKPDLPEEQHYIESRGGVVQGGRVSGMLAVSRALGDGLFNDLINPTPCFTYGKLSPDDSYLILACDGVWDVMKDQEAVDLIATEIDPLQAAKKIRDKAYERHSQDNISVIVVFLAEAFAEQL